MNAFGRGASPAIPDTVAHLDADVVVETLSRHANNVSAAADELGVASADLRRLCHARPQLQAVAAEMEERELDLAEANISGFLRSKDDRLRLAASMFKIRNSVRARRRGWITSSAASVDVNLNANQPPQRIIVTWRNPNGTDDDDDDNTETIERDGKRIPVPCYGRTPDDCLEGEVATPAAMIGHQADAEPEPEQVAVEPVAIEPVAPLPTLLKWHDPYSGPPPRSRICINRMCQSLAAVRRNQASRGKSSTNDWRGSLLANASFYWRLRGFCNIHWDARNPGRLPS